MPMHPSGLRVSLLTDKNKLQSPPRNSNKGLQKSNHKTELTMLKTQWNNKKEWFNEVPWKKELL
jgi:hypothetical protein